MTEQSGRTLNSVLGEIDLQYARLKSLLAEIPDERLSEAGVSGQWSAKDLLSHVSYWMDDAVDSLDRVLTGESETGDQDWQATNEKVAAQHASRSLADAKGALHSAYMSLVAGTSAVADDDEHAQAAFAKVEDAGAEHVREHVDELSAWWDKVKNGG